MKRSELRNLILEELSAMDQLAIGANRAIHGTVDAVGDAVDAVDVAVTDAMVRGEKLDVIGEWDMLSEFNKVTSAMFSDPNQQPDEQMEKLLLEMLRLAHDNNQALSADYFETRFDAFVDVIRKQEKLGRKNSNS